MDKRVSSVLNESITLFTIDRFGRTQESLSRSSCTYVKAALHGWGSERMTPLDIHSVPTTWNESDASTDFTQKNVLPLPPRRVAALETSGIFASINLAIVLHLTLHYAGPNRFENFLL